MTWEEFNQIYLIEARIVGTVDVAFDDNTPVYAIGKPSISNIQIARIINRMNLQIEKEYEFYLDSEDVRSIDNELKKNIVRDFGIKEITNQKHALNSIKLFKNTKIHSVTNQKTG